MNYLCHSSNFSLNASLSRLILAIFLICFLHSSVLEYRVSFNFWISWFLLTLLLFYCWELFYKSFIFLLNMIVLLNWKWDHMLCLTAEVIECCIYPLHNIFIDVINKLEYEIFIFLFESWPSVLDWFSFLEYPFFSFYSFMFIPNRKLY